MSDDMPELLPCQDIPDTHEWSEDYKELANGQGITKYCLKCGLTAMAHTMRIF